MEQLDVPSLPLEFLHTLLHTAGISALPTRTVLLGVSTAQVWEVTVGEQLYVLRYLKDGDREAVAKEQYLSDLLHRHGVSAPLVLATVAHEQGIASLATRLPGIPLSQALLLFSPNDTQTAWRSVGAALSHVHAIVLSVAGEIVGERIQPFASRWGTWVLEDLTEDVHWLQAHLNTPPVEQSLLEHIVTAGAALLDHRPVRLIHNDALPQNIIVAQGPTGWYCTGWLDWECSRAGDPLWDLATLDFRPAGLVPSSFYEGYGSFPPEPERTLYELLTTLWRTRAELEHGISWDWPPQQARIGYVRNLSAHINQLAHLL